MALDFPLSLRLREEEDLAIRELVKKEPLLEKATIGTGLVLLGLEQARKSGDGFERLLCLLRRRRQGLPLAEAS